MSTLYRDLPSFATDYSGFISLMYGLGGLMVVHDPSGCLGNYTNCDEPRWFYDPQSVYSTRLRELEAVLGGNSDTKEKILKEIRRNPPPFVCILGTSVPALTGCDLTDLAERIEEEGGVPCYTVETDGFHFYDTGIQKALLLLQSFMKQDVPKEENCVNVLGMTPLDYSLYGEKEKLTALLENQGWFVSAFLGMGNDLAAVATARKAEKNIVMTSAAIPLARKMEREDGIPFFAGPPLGEMGLARLYAFLHNEPVLEIPENGNGLEKTLLIGEQLACNALRNSLYAEGYVENISVASFFTMDRAQMTAEDVLLRDEEHLRNLISSGEYHTIIGDPLFKTLCRGDQVFHPRAHPAVSSKLHWKEAMSLIG